MLKTDGRPRSWVPDNVLFEGGAGETIRQKLLDNTDLHTILRLPTAWFYAQGVKANVIFFDNREASPDPWTKQVWYYDYRTNIHHTLKKKPMRYEDLLDFVKCCNRGTDISARPPGMRPTRRKAVGAGYSYEELTARDKTSLDVFWLKDKSLTDLDNLPEPDDSPKRSSRTSKPASTVSAKCLRLTADRSLISPPSSVEAAGLLARPSADTVADDLCRGHRWLPASRALRNFRGRFTVFEDDHPEPEGDAESQKEAIIVKHQLNAEEREILEHFERGELTPASGAQREMETARHAARNTFNKTRRVNCGSPSATSNSPTRVRVRRVFRTRRCCRA